jgi:hypothetical protein
VSNLQIPLEQKSDSSDRSFVLSASKIGNCRAGCGAILVLSTSVLAEIWLLRFRKLPFTCSYRPFQSHSGLVVVAYWFGFIFFTGYLVEFERWSLFDPWQVLGFGLLWGLAMAAVRHYRRHMLMMDKELLFEELQVSTF